ncbi:undecaprenyl diphosphate synthase family protein [Candidatus Woesearchaeota archaeon]|nr:MAG: tritrans,polycis-undecaprenyl-diphosphate synthase geranylgeranyl-diphosphate specific [archaeon GW2011_AR4]MBS3129460.1 undecaprenyl diphosphate synthase family protein [Candidatus Woesearchaeota archaeon]HIH38920.1 hypothetical protein [Candidatus Woesearchaeota archaeon]HIH49690.1 hypothetical protein [Candidatus Woesearchaeota archaeon]HIJ03747.1 hypothetical protein [Candidatus Woesearchaeota archaeon]
MAIFDRLLNIKKNSGPVKNRNPLHIALTMQGTKKWMDKNPGKDVAKLRLQKVDEIMIYGLKQNIPVMTFFLLPAAEFRQEAIPGYQPALSLYFQQLLASSILHDNQVRVSFLGRWYDLEPEVIEGIKSLLNATTEYDKFFVNFCINYNGRSELTNAVKLLVKQAEAKKLTADNVTEELIKDSLYSSALLPPELVIKTGEKRFTSLLLWDTPGALVYFTDKAWMDFSTSEFDRAIDFFHKEGKV